MTIQAWLDEQAKIIPRLDAELLLIHILEQADRSYLVAHNQDQLDSSFIASADSLVKRRAEGEPLAYIIGYREFYGRRFFVTPDVLIPRPETETIIDIAKEIKPDSILDVGTGSGCIAITLALELPEANIAALDISDEALAIAQKNAAHHSATINFHKSDLLNNYMPEPNTLIIANLPYVDPEWTWLKKQDLDYEPSIALYSEQGGLSHIYSLIDQAPTSCELILEADPSQHEAIKQYAAQKGRQLKKSIGYILYFQ